jgi:hypothetical protein
MKHWFNVFVGYISADLRVRLGGKGEEYEEKVYKRLFVYDFEGEEKFWNFVKERCGP